VTAVKERGLPPEISMIRSGAGTLILAEETRILD